MYGGARGTSSAKYAWCQCDVVPIHVGSQRAAYIHTYTVHIYIHGTTQRRWAYSGKMCLPAGGPNLPDSMCCVQHTNPSVGTPQRRTLARAPPADRQLRQWTIVHLTSLGSYPLCHAYPCRAVNKAGNPHVPPSLPNAPPPTGPPSAIQGLSRAAHHAQVFQRRLCRACMIRCQPFHMPFAAILHQQLHPTVLL